MTISDYLKDKEAYQEPLYRLINGKGFFIVNDKRVEVETWQSQNPKPIYIPPVPDNPDKQHIS